MISKACVSCGKAIDITNANKLYTRLKKPLEMSFSAELKTGIAEWVYRAGLQLFAALVKEIVDSGGSTLWKFPGELLLSTVRRLGLVTRWCLLASN